MPTNTSPIESAEKQPKTWINDQIGATPQEFEDHVLHGIPEVAIKGIDGKVFEPRQVALSAFTNAVERRQQDKPPVSEA